MKEPVDLKKRYRTRSGLEVELYAIHPTNELSWQLMGAVSTLEGRWEAKAWTIYGEYDLARPGHELDLVEITSFDDFKIDDPVLVSRKIDGSHKFREHFAGMSPKGYPMTWPYGGTSWTRAGERPIVWDTCEKAPEDK